MNIGLLTGLLATVVTSLVSADHIDNYLNDYNVEVLRSYQTESMKDSGLEALFTTTGILYAQREAGLLFTSPGELFHFSSSEPESETAAMKDEFLKVIPDKIVAQAPNEKLRIQVFTDISCPHCRDFHGRVPQYLEAGITVEFLLVAREGRTSLAYQQMSSLAFEDDQEKALSDGMASGYLPRSEMASFQMAMHQQAAEIIGIKGTPTVLYKGMDIGNLPPQQIGQAIIEVDEITNDTVVYDVTKYE
ncbi:thioredoxin fold domain-containing protein [Vibrio agarivorans]|uniref:Thioredoxin fold domain-containing protein n=1 Tax=Vibrio agarivorans TaxID=153622 RepID=A0ABT7Y851_9VIBR|nr:thioredoxin fold domain-containing protein [Vibrio agarivorans]MDN2483934.1 thioredoxin fold domain-containing protein [Vibrio agarivorans]